MGELYGFNPYLAGPHALAVDPLYQYIGSKWIDTPTVYGPVFTALSYLLAPLSISASVFAYKAIAALSSLAIVALVWNGARLRGVDQTRAAALVGLNPLIVVYGVGGGHNDLLMLAPMVAGIVLLLQRRGRLGAGSIVLGAAVKVTAGLMLPFALADARGPHVRRPPPRPPDRRRRRPPRCSPCSAFVLFGTGPLHLPATIEKVQSKGNWQSIPGFIGARLGLRHGRPAGGAGARRAVRRRGCAGCCGACGAASSTGSRRPAGPRRAAGHRRVATTLVHSVADAAGRARTGPPPVAGLDPANGRDRVLPAARLHPPRKLAPGTVSRS